MVGEEIELAARGRTAPSIVGATTGSLPTP